MPLTELSGLYVYLGPRGTPDGTGAPRPRRGAAPVGSLVLGFDLARRAERSFHLTLALGAQTAKVRLKPNHRCFKIHTTRPDTGTSVPASGVPVPRIRGVGSSAAAGARLRSRQTPDTVSGVPHMHNEHAKDQHDCSQDVKVALCTESALPAHTASRPTPRPTSTGERPDGSGATLSSRRPWRQRMRARPPPAPPCSPSQTQRSPRPCAGPST